MGHAGGDGYGKSQSGWPVGGAVQELLGIRFVQRGQYPVPGIESCRGREVRAVAECFKCERSAAISRGSRGFRPELWVPPPEDSFQFVVEDLGSCLEQEMSSTEGPLHL